MLDGMPLVDVHLHTASKPSLKLPWDTWVQGFADGEAMARRQHGRKARPLLLGDVVGVDVRERARRALAADRHQAVVGRPPSQDAATFAAAGPQGGPRHETDPSSVREKQD